MLTKKGKYGLKALSALSRQPDGHLMGVAELAEANAIPKKFLDAILAELRNAGFVRSKKGKLGGYALARPAGEIMIGHVVRVLDHRAVRDLGASGAELGVKRPGVGRPEEDVPGPALSLVRADSRGVGDQPQHDREPVAGHDGELRR